MSDRRGNVQPQRGRRIRRKRTGRRSTTMGAASLLALLLASNVVPAQSKDQEAGDLVVFTPGLRYTGELSIRGTIVDYSGSEITIQLKNGQQRSFPTSEVLRYETTRTKSWAEAEEHFESHEYILAATDFERALNEEPREWVRREILARLTWCYRFQGDPVRAGDTFLSLQKNDPETPFFSAIPLEWVGGETSPELTERARRWLGREESAAARLIGASHLLAGSDRSIALETLRDLVKQPDRRIAILAAAQIWRTQVGQADEDQLRRWEDVVGRLPSSLRAGPYFVLGKGYALRRLPERAALSFLWVPLVYNEDPLLAAEACLEAGDALSASGQPIEAQTLYREVIVKYGFTPAAREARVQLQGLSPKQTDSRAEAS